LEVILALAILTGALAALGEVARNTMQNVTVDSVLTRAEMLCESKLAEIVSGMTPPQPAQGTLTYDGQELGDPGWQYTLEVDPIDSQGLVAVRITVQQDLPAERHPVEFSLVRWMTTPDALASLSNANSTGNSGNANSSSQSPAAASAPPSGTGGGS
jgi:type II secretory pathway pseudopilin PulG